MKNSYSRSEPTATIIWVSHVVARAESPIYLLIKDWKIGDIKIMKKLLSIFTMTVLTLTASTNIIACNNSNVPIPTINTVKFKLMDGIKEATTLAIDSKDNLYTSDKNGNIYKCLAGKNEFEKFATIKNIEINGYSKTYIRIDNDDNIFFIKDKEIYKCLAGENTFSEVTNIQRSISSIIIDKNNNIFLLSTIIQQDSEIYKCLAGKNTFNKIDNINDVYAGGKLVLDSNNNIYMGITKINGKGNIYKCLAGENTFNKISEIEEYFVDFTLDKNNNIYAIDNAKSVYQMLANDKDIHMINNQLSMSNNTIITDQKNKVYISNFNCGVYESD